MSQDHKMKPYYHENHAKPVTRRQLVSQGFLSGAGFVAAPSILAMLERRAFGAEPVCAKGAAAATTIPVIVIDLAGGANLAGSNVLVGGQNGQMDFLPAGSYATIGVAAAAEPQTVAPDTTFGLAFNARSQMLVGMKARTTAPTQANIDGVVFAATSNDDSRGNPLNPLYWVVKSGTAGELVSFVGTSDGASAGRSAAPPASIDPSKAPSRITAPADSAGLVNPGTMARILAVGSTADRGVADVKKILAATKVMSESKLKMFQQQDLPTQVQDLIRCGYINSSDFLSKFSATALDPAADTMVTGQFNMADPLEARAASITKLVLDGYAGAGVIEMGGYDYHGQGRAAQNTKDQAAGRMIGNVLELAAKKQKPVMVYVYTDGGVSANAGGAPDANGLIAFTSDSGERSSTFALVYKPGAAGRPAMRSTKRQIGAFKAGGSVDGTASKISNAPELTTKAFVANYLALTGREGDLAKIVGDNPFGSELDKHLAFAKIM